MELILEISNWITDLFVQGGTEDVMDQLIQKGQAIKEMGNDIKDVAEKAKKDQPRTWLDLQAFDQDFWKLVFRFALNFSVLFIIVRMLYYPIAKRKEFKHKEIAKWFAKRMKMCYDWVECVESKNLEVT